MLRFSYNAAHPIVCQVLKMMIWGTPLAVGPLLQLAIAQAGTCNSQKNVTEPRQTFGWATLYMELILKLNFGFDVNKS